MRLRCLLPVCPGLLFVLLVYVVPVATLLSQGVLAPHFTLEHLERLFSSAVYIRVVIYTVEMSLLVAALCVLLGYPLAYLMAFASQRVRLILTIAVSLPFLTSVLVRTYAWMVILGNNGVLNQLLLRLGIVDEPVAFLFNTTGVVIGMVHVLLPYAVLPLYSVLQGVDRSLSRAAASLGAGEMRTFFFVVLPQTWAGIFAAFLLVFVLALGFYITPALLGGRRDVFIAQLIQAQVSTFLNWNFAGVLSLLLLVVTGVTLAFVTRRIPASVLFGHEGITLAAAPPRHRGRLLEQLGNGLSSILKPMDRVPFERAVIAPGAGLTALFLVIPIFIVVPLSFTAAPYLTFPPPSYSPRWYEELAGSFAWQRAALNSLQIATISMLISIVLGTSAAFGLMRGDFPGRHLLYGLFVSPLVVPAVVLGVSIYRVFLPLQFVNAPIPLAIAHTVVGLPVVVMIMMSVLRGIDPALERAAASLGARPLRSFRHVTLPLVKPGLLSAATVAFLLSFDELVITLFVGGTRTITLPLKMWEGTREEISPMLAAVATVLVVVECLGLLILSWARHVQRLRTATISMRCL